MPDAVPLTVLAGYLGAGKTTRLNRLLARPGGHRFGVLVNDFGQVDVDSLLIDDADERTIGLANGCVCCTIADDLGGALERLAAIRPVLDHVVLEASGVADPGRLSNWARTWPGFHLAGCTVIADASRIRALSDDRYVGLTVLRQLAGANRILLSMTESMSAASIAELAQWLGDKAPGAQVIRSPRDGDASHLLGRGRSSSGSGSLTTGPPVGTASHGRHLADSADASAAHRAVTLATDRALDARALRRLLTAPPHGLVRLKGWFQRHDRIGRMWMLQFAHGRWQVTPGRGSPQPATTLVAISADPDLSAEALLERLQAVQAPTGQ